MKDRVPARRKEMNAFPDFTNVDLDAISRALIAIQEALEEFPDDLRGLIRVEPLDRAAVDQATRCGAGHVSHVDRDGHWSCPCRPAAPDAQGRFDLSATAGGWRVVVAASRTEGVLVIPVDGGDLIVAHDEGTYVFPADNEWAGSEIAIGIALDLSAAGALKGWNDETEEGFAKRADGTVLLPWMCAC